MSTRFFLACLVLAFAGSRGFAQGVTFRYDHTVAVKDLAEEKEEKASLSNPVVMQLPAFPPEMLHAWVSGEASIRFQVHEDGSVSDATVTSATHAEFGEAARIAAGRWKFSPSVHRVTRKVAKIWARCRIIFKVDSE